MNQLAFDLEPHTRRYKTPMPRLAARTRLQSQQINKRTADMHKVGAIRPTGAERLSASGRPERVWEAVEE